MFVVTPVLDSHLQVEATLGLKIRPEREFTRILQLGRLGESGRVNNKTSATSAAMPMTKSGIRR